MRMTTAFLAYELRTQLRSLRFRAFAAAYVGLCSLPAFLIYVQRGQFRQIIGAAAFAYETLTVAPLLTGVFAVLLALDGITREQGGGAWTTVTLTGLTNAGYLLRRWLALEILILPLTALPIAAAAGLALASGFEIPTPAVFWGPWLLRILPLAFLASTLGLALGTLGGGGMSTFVVAGVAMFLLPQLANTGLALFGYRLSPFTGWLATRNANYMVQRVLMTFKSEEDRMHFPNPACEAGFDVASAAEQSLGDGAVQVALAIAVLGLSVAWLRRTRPDIRPRTIRPDHPLRSFLAVLSRLRERLVPDPAPAPADRLAIALALLLAIVPVGIGLARAHRYDELAWQRQEAEAGGRPAPTSRDVMPGRWRVTGRLGPGSAVALRVAAELRNEGKEPARRIAFSLNPELVLEEATAERGGLRLRRTWDRLEVDLEPPLGPGEHRELRFRLTGRPAAPVFPPPLQSSTARLVAATRPFAAHQQARFGRDLMDYSRSFQVPAISGYRVDLEASDLSPIPRYGTWALTEQRIVPDEVFLPKAQIELSLEVPPGLFLADTCGGVAHQGRLASLCAQPLHDLGVVGGRYRVLGEEGSRSGATVAVFPAHREVGETHLGFLARGERMMRDAWPGIGGLEDLVVLEWPDAGTHDQRDPRPLGSYFYWDPDRDYVEVRGQLAFVREIDLLWNQPVRPESLVAEVVASRLVARRRFVFEQQYFFRQLIRNLVLERLGVGSRFGANVYLERLEELDWIRTPALHPEYGRTYWWKRFPSLVAALAVQTGAEPLRDAVEELLTAPTDEPATFDEFAAILRRRSERPVDGMIRDFFLDGKLPRPVLEGVEFRRAGNLWRATGRMRNEADGEISCRVVLMTDVAPVEATLTVDTGGSAPFALESPYRPQGLFLDPDNECHRLVMKTGNRDRFYFNGEER